MAGGGGNDTLHGGAGADTVMASVNCSLTAASEIEFLRPNVGTAGLSLTGDALANRFVGGVGNATLDGCAGNDSLGGGAGNDVFKFLAGFGQDTITDFTTHAGAAGNRDLLDISKLGITAGTFAASFKITNGGGGAVMVTAGSGSIRILNAGPSVPRSPARPIATADKAVWIDRRRPPAQALMILHQHETAQTGPNWPWVSSGRGATIVCLV